MTSRLSRLLPLGALLLALAACATNPVTGRKELNLVSQQQEIAIGQENYSPSRQMQGGDVVVDPQLTAYVQQVGQRLAAVSDRQLPYEFQVINNSVPNAWALPGGKIAVNRGLLTELNSEAELAAVLGHEITHAAAGHGRQAMQRGMLLQAAAVGLQFGVQDNRYANLIVGGAMLGANLITQKYGRDAERESDQYGMGYMKRAGYDPAAAIALQETFVRLSQGKQSGWLEGLFASHPPSTERVANNQTTASTLGMGGDVGVERYAAAMKSMRERMPAYRKYDEGVAALAKGDAKTAESLAKEALALEPKSGAKDGKFPELLGDVELSRKNWREARGWYEKAMALNPNYFKPQLAAGLASFELRESDTAQRLLARSMELLPTATGSYYLGRLAQQGGRVDEAVKMYQMAASSDSEVGRASARELAELDLPRNPGNYFRIEPRVDSQGRVWLLVENRSPVKASAVVLAAAVANANGSGFAQGPVRVTSGDAVIGPGEVAQIPTALGPLSDPRMLQLVKAEVQGARIVD